MTVVPKKQWQPSATKIRTILNKGTQWPRTGDASWWERRQAGVPVGRQATNELRGGIIGASMRGSFLSRKMQREVSYDSLLERRFFELLDECPSVATFVEQPASIGYCPAYQVDLREVEVAHYVPDVAVNLMDSRGLFVEIKPRSQMALAEHVERYFALREFCEDFNLGWLVVDSRALLTLAGMLRVPVPSDFQRAMGLKLRIGSVGWTEVRSLMRATATSQAGVNAYVLQRNLVWTSHPYQIRHPTATELNDGPWSTENGIAAVIRQTRSEEWPRA